MVLLVIVIQLNLKCKVVDDTSNSMATVGLYSTKKTLNLLRSMCKGGGGTHSWRDLFKVFDFGFGQVGDISGIILVKEFFKKSN